MVLEEGQHHDWLHVERVFTDHVMVGMALAPWNVLGAGKIRTDEEERRRLESGEGGRSLHGFPWQRTEDERKVCLALEKIAQEVGAKHITSGKWDDCIIRVTF